MITHMALVLGENFFLGFRPVESPDNCVVMLERPGMTYHEELRAERVIQIQFIIRDIEYPAGELVAKTLSELLANHKQFPIAGWMLHRCDVAGPGYLGQDKSGRHEWTLNADILVRKE